MSLSWSQSKDNFTGTAPTQASHYLKGFTCETPTRVILRLRSVVCQVLSVILSIEGSPREAQRERSAAQLPPVDIAGLSCPAHVDLAPYRPAADCASRGDPSLRSG